MRKLFLGLALLSVLAFAGCKPVATEEAVTDETPAVEETTPAVVETPAVETPAVETPAE